MEARQEQVAPLALAGHAAANVSFRLVDDDVRIFAEDRIDRRSFGVG